jgi:uncharacterized protein
LSIAGKALGLIYALARPSLPALARSPGVIRPLIPSLLEIDTFDGWCWIGVVPFRMTGVRPRFVPLSFAFPELNVRTYVKSPGRSGVWFFSLWLGLPYYDARMTVELDQDVVHYKSVRLNEKAAPAEFDASYRPTAAVYYFVPGTLDHWAH